MFIKTESTGPADNNTEVRPELRHDANEAVGRPGEEKKCSHTGKLTI